jgi:hypothetical protein
VGQDDRDIEDAVSRGIERGVGNVVTNIAEAYVIGGCFILILTAIGLARLWLVVLGFVVCGK